MINAIFSLKLFRSCSVLFLLLWCFVANAAITTIEEAINKAGRQRMLSQRVAKAYIQIGLMGENRLSRKVLAESVASIDQSLVELKAFAPTPLISDLYVRIEQKWRVLKARVQDGTMTVQNAKAVLQASDDLLAQAELATKQFQLYSGKNLARLVNIAGRERMLSQKIAMLAQAREWSLVVSSDELEGLRQEFVKAMQILESASETTPQIKVELSLAHGQWLFLNQAIQEKDLDRQVRIKNIATTSERILEALDQVTAMYANRHVN